MKSSRESSNISPSNFNQEIHSSLYLSPENLNIYPYCISLHSQKPQGANFKYYRFDYIYNHPFHSSWTYISPSITDTKVPGDDFWIDYSQVHKNDLIYHPNHDPFPDEIDCNFYTYEIEQSIQKIFNEETKLKTEAFNPSKTKKRINKVLNEKDETSSLSYTPIPKESKKLMSSISIEYPCRICEKTYSSIQGFKVHIKTHTIEPPFNCVVCDKSFKRRSSLIRHWITVVCTKNLKISQLVQK